MTIIIFSTILGVSLAILKRYFEVKKEQRDAKLFDERVQQIIKDVALQKQLDNTFRFLKYEQEINQFKEYSNHTALNITYAEDPITENSDYSNQKVDFDEVLDYSPSYGKFQLRPVTA